MKRPLRPDEKVLWGVVTATVRPAASRHATPAEASTEALASPPTKPAPKPPPKFVKPLKTRAPAVAVVTKARAAVSAVPESIEPRRKRRIIRERDDLGARIDLHGLDQDAARSALHGFLLRAQADGVRAVLVITGKGSLGDGILRKRAPDWLAEPVVRHAVAGVSEAHRRHGGAGALYVALKRKA